MNFHHEFPISCSPSTTRSLNLFTSRPCTMQNSDDCYLHSSVTFTCALLLGITIAAKRLFTTIVANIICYAYWLSSYGMPLYLYACHPVNFLMSRHLLAWSTHHRRCGHKFMPNTDCKHKRAIEKIHWFESGLGYSLKKERKRRTTRERESGSKRRAQGNEKQKNTVTEKAPHKTKQYKSRKIKSLISNKRRPMKN